MFKLSEVLGGIKSELGIDPDVMHGFLNDSLDEIKKNLSESDPEIVEAAESAVQLLNAGDMTVVLTESQTKVITLCAIFLTLKE